MVTVLPVLGIPTLDDIVQPPSMYSNRGPIAKHEAPLRIVLIVLDYQGQGNHKDGTNQRGDGKVLSFVLFLVLDKKQGQMTSNSVADQFYNQIEPLWKSKLQILQLC